MASATAQEPIPVSLIDLNEQLPFNIDKELNFNLCFSETLVITCGHGAQGGDDSDSDWTCTKSSKTSSEVAPEVMTEGPIEFKDDDDEEEKEPEEDDFHIFFFPDCSKKPGELKSKMSLDMTSDGLPKLKTKVDDKINFCTCSFDKTGKCKCHPNAPCYCFDKPKPECLCGLTKKVCICDKDNICPKCYCKANEFCDCFDDGIYPKCICKDIEVPCICVSTYLPKPVCSCEPHAASSISVEHEEQVDLNFRRYKGQNIENCECQAPKPGCICTKGSCKLVGPHECLNTTEAVEYPRKCTCDLDDDGECTCFEPLKPVCDCGDDEDCKCFENCNCPDPCLCDLNLIKGKECLCLDKTNEEDCTYKPPKLKRVKAGKEGYRWCHDVDPYHTYFDFAYDRHDKIDENKREREKFKILGLGDVFDKNVKEEQQEKVKRFKKQVPKPSVDCCSAVGGICISVVPIGEQKEKFLVQIVSHSSKEGQKTGTKLVSIVDSKLHTLEENRTEHIATGEFIKERKSYMAICATGYYNKITHNCGDHSVVKRYYHKFENARDFLMEGANILLLRYIALTRFKGIVKTDSTLIDGTICKSIYNSFGVSAAVVNGVDLFVVKIERNIMKPSGQMYQSLTVMSLKGYMISHEWADSCYVMHINPLLKIDKTHDTIERHNPLREKWREDLQLMSDYLDFKRVRTGEGVRYMSESGELANNIRDFLQAILLLKPQDILHYTRHYFKSAVSALDLPRDDYFDPCPKHVRYYYFEE